MKYDVVQQSLEAYIKANWTATQIQFDNTAFNSDLYTEFLRCNVRFGDSASRTVTKGCYRQTGVLFLSIFTKPATGSARQMALATAAANLMNDVVVNPVSPLVAPRVNFLEPSFHGDNKERDGWIMAQVACAFYYDFQTI